MYQDFIPFLKVNDIPLYNTSLLFTREPVDGHLGCFLILAVVSDASVNTGNPVILFTFHLYVHPMVGLLDHIVVPFLIL